MFQGRPASISPAELDTRFPSQESFPTDENGIVQKDCGEFHLGFGLFHTELVGFSCNLSVYDGEGCRMAVTRGCEPSETNNILGDPCLGPGPPHRRCSREVLPNS
jgi:hypothetical protein